MTRTMHDSTTGGDAPDGANLYADYLDIPSSHDPRATVHICRDGNVNDGHVLDVGEGVPNRQAPGWARMRRAAGVEPTIYTNYANWSAVRGEFALADEPQPQWWIAWYTTDQGTIARCFAEGAVAVQWANPPISGGHYDISAVADHWPGVDGVVTPNTPTSTPAAPEGDEDMKRADVDAVIKEAYVIGGIVQALRRANLLSDIPVWEFVDSAQQAAFAEWGDKVMAGTEDLHAAANDIIRTIGAA